MVEKFVKKRWQKSDGNPVLRERDPFLVDKVFTITFTLLLLSFASASLQDRREDVFVVAFIVLLFLGLGALIGYSLFKDKRKEIPEISMFPAKFRDGFFFYSSFIIDISLPLFFFLWISLNVFGDYIAETMFEPMLVAPTFPVSLLIFSIYGLVFTYGFPTQLTKAAWQLFIRIFTFGLMVVFNDSIFDALFMYGLLEVVSLCIVCAAFFLAHHLFKDPEGNANRVFKYDLTMILVAVFFGVPILLWGVLLYVLGFLYFFSPTLEYNVYIEILVWMGLIFPILFTHFQSLRNYSVGFYRAIPKD